MCGRVALFTPPVRLARLLDAALAAGIEPEGHPSWNIGPLQRLFGVAKHDGGRVLERYRWGLLPSWAKDPTIANRLFNARAETVMEKPSFRSAFAKRPCAIPVDGFYEWDHRKGHVKQPHYFTRVDGEPIVLAGLYEQWRSTDATSDAATIMSCTIITTTPNEDMDGLHDRMPVVLGRGDVEQWIDVANLSPDERVLLLRPAESGTLTHVGVQADVGYIRNDGPHLILPLESKQLF